MTIATVAGTTGVIVIVATALCVVSLVVLHLLPTGLSPLANPVSQYGITNYRAGYRVQTVAMGVAGIAAAIGISKLHLSGGSFVIVLLVVFGAARLLISWFPMDTPGAERSETGRRHGLLAILAFGGVTIGAIRLGTDLGNSGEWPSAHGALVGLGVAMLVTFVAMGAARRNEGVRRYFGLVERAFYLEAIGFLFLVGTELISTH